VEVPNPEAVLVAYDARVMEAIEERLPLESAPIDVGDGRCVIAIRVPNSAKKPHSVRHQGHIYFPSRRERQRYHMTVREIKELAMRTASRMQQAEEMLESAFLGVTRSADMPYLMIGVMPAFFEGALLFLSSIRFPTERRPRRSPSTVQSFALMLLQSSAVDNSCRTY
jgi:hypothetical protein